MFSKFSDEIRRRRTVLGLTLEQLAKRSGLTANYIGTIENEKRDPSLSTIVGLAKGFGIPVRELFSSTMNLSPIGEEIGRYCDQLPEGIQRALLSIIRAFSRKGRPRRRGKLPAS